MLVQVFKTNVDQAETAALLAASLLGNPEVRCVNFDLDDCDRVLRIELNTPAFDRGVVINLLRKEGFACEKLI